METEKKCEKKKSCKDWATTIPEFGGLSINEAFPLDGEMLKMLDVALRHLGRQWPEVSFEYAPRAHILADLRGRRGFNDIHLARMAPRQHWVSYTIKALRNAVRDAYFDDTELQNPFKAGFAAYRGSSVPDLVDFREFVRKLRADSDTNLAAVPDSCPDSMAELEEKSFDAVLNQHFPIVWALRRGYSLADVRDWLGTARESKVSDAQLSQDILAEACGIAQLSGQPLDVVRRRLAPLLAGLRGSRGSYRGVTPAQPGVATGEEESEAIRLRYAS